MPKTGGDLVLETLKAAGVDTVFGIISVHNIPIYDAIARGGGVRPIMVRHEQGAVGMADGYARATGKLGVAITSTGPGAANGMGAMLEAYSANSPVLMITGNIEQPYLGKGKGFLHEAKDQLAMLRTATKWAAGAESTEAIPAVLGEAIRQALSGRKRPVAIEIPIDLQYFEADAVVPSSFEPYLPPSPNGEAVRMAAQLLASARRPLIWAGGGALAAGAGPEILALARQLGAGVLTSATGRGVIPEDDPLCFGNLSWEPVVQELAAGADVLLAIGTRFQAPNTQNWRMKLPETIIHVNIDREEFNRNYPAAVGIEADAKEALREIIGALEHVAQASSPANIVPGSAGPGSAGILAAGAEPGWRERVLADRDRARQNQRASLGPHAEVMDALRKALPPDAIVVKDATVPAYTWGNRLLEVYQPRTSINAAAVGIGPGLPLALGAAVGRPDRRVALIAGDGGFQLTMNELSTAAQYGLNVTSIVFNDRAYGVLKNIQEGNFEGRHIAVDLPSVDFVKVAEGMGVPGLAVPAKEAFPAAIQWALAQPGPALLDVDMDGIGPFATAYRGTSRRPERR